MEANPNGVYLPAGVPPPPPVREPWPEETAAQWPVSPAAMPTLPDQIRCRVCHCRLRSDQLSCPSCGELLTLGPPTSTSWVSPEADEVTVPGGVFVDLGALAALLRILLSVLAVAAGAALLADIAHLTFLNAFIAAPDDLSQADQLAFGERWQSVLDVVVVLALIPAVGVLALFSHRAYENVSALTTPASRPWPTSWVVLGWLIPLVNLVFPKLVLDHLWRTSAAVGDGPASGSDQRPPFGLQVAWGCAVAAVLFGFAAYVVGETDLFVTPGVVDLQIFRWQAYLAIVGGAAMLTASLLGASLARELSNRQQARHHHLLITLADPTTSPAAVG
jgi:hypothetical protein